MCVYAFISICFSVAQCARWIRTTAWRNGGFQCSTRTPNNLYWVGLATFSALWRCVLSWFNNWRCVIALMVWELVQLFVWLPGVRVHYVKISVCDTHTHTHTHTVSPDGGCNRGGRSLSLHSHFSQNVSRWKMQTHRYAFNSFPCSFSLNRQEAVRRLLKFDSYTRMHEQIHVSIFGY